MDSALVPGNVPKETLERLMTQYGDSVKRICLVYLKNTQLCEDAAQECFVKAFEALKRGRGPAPAAERAWLMQVAVNTCRDYYRSRWFRHVDKRVDLDALPLPAPPFEGEAWTVTQKVMALPARFKELVLLYYYQGLTLREITQATGLHLATAHRRLRKAQELLRQRLTGGED